MMPARITHGRRWGLVVGALGALSLGCAGPGSTPPGTSTSATGGGAGSGGTDPTDSGGSGGTAPGTGGTGNAGGTGGAAGMGSAGAPDAAGAAGMAGAEGDDGPLTCDSFSGDDPHDRCEPKLRALLSSRDDEPLLRFEYNAAGQIARVLRDQKIQHQYSYDSQGRLVRLEDDCDDEDDECTTLYEFSYADAGRLETMTLDDTLRTTYDEDGRVLEVRLNYVVWNPAGSRSRYRYRSDGQIESIDRFEIDVRGIETLTTTEFYEYGDDDLLDSIQTERGSSNFVAVVGHVLEDGRVRVETTTGDFQLPLTIFDDVDRPAFGHDTLDYQSENQTVYVGDIEYVRYVSPSKSTPVTEWWYQRTRHALEAPEPKFYRFPRPFGSAQADDVLHHMFPYRPFDLTETDIDDFVYLYHNGRFGYDFARQPSFSDAGLLEHLTFSVNRGDLNLATIDIDLLRCGSAVVESIDFSGSPADDPEAAGDEVRVYYYGCDDFELPTKLPKL